MNKKEQTIDTYNKSAQALADKFNSQGVRSEDIHFVFSLVEKLHPAVLEIGCGNGRDASGILKLTNNYLGIDISENLIKIARFANPQGKFEVADIEDYILPPNLDIVFAFASLIHVPKESLEKILLHAYEKMNSGGIFFISLKHNDIYSEVTKNDEYGTRTYYHYSENDIKTIAHDFHNEKITITDIRGQMWIEITLKKI